MILHSDNPRRENDFYPTPYGLCRAGIDSLPKDFQPCNILDPGCGSGRWGKVLREFYPHALLIGTDIVEDIPLIKEYNKYAFFDYTKLNLTFMYTEFDLVIGNPPYKFAESFIINSLSYLNIGGYLMFSLRLGFLESESRRKRLFSVYPPKEVLICSRRPSFNTPNNRRTDGTAYAIFLWERGWQGDPIIKWLDWDYDKELDYE